MKPSWGGVRGPSDDGSDDEEYVGEGVGGK